ncbi:PREDICTED: translation machinery-associated protein 22-like [Nicotiana attenuata]|uniref:DENR N-terminal domain-containing protein n=1 Tax=Nicotiana attenuata TaxID=49451 RepID=A0A1J6JMN7_NICAT|nr:PREDICTED: translation machinery-associated protein 22-like [Nicotiana attenuata]OIT19045.1 hypothetical protein A4A49_63517 [Nicotiana attenuata]
MAEKPQPVEVLYCGVCGLPAEYCEFGSEFEKCKPWLIQNAPDLYPDLLKDANGKDADKVSDQLQSTSISEGSSTSKQEEVKRLPGGKIKKKVRSSNHFSFCLMYINPSSKNGMALCHPCDIISTEQIQFSDALVIL